MPRQPNPHCRIGRVWRKDAPHLVELHPPVRGMEFRQQAERWVERVFEDYKDTGLAAIVTVAIGFDGGHARGFRIHKDAAFGTVLLPSIVAEILRCDTIANIAEEVFTGEA